MSWFDDVCDAVSDVVEEVGEAVGTAVEAVGDAIDDGLNWLGENTGAVGAAIFGWMGDIISGAFHLVGAIIKGVFGFAAGILSGVLRILGGIFTLDGDLILQGLGDIFSSFFGGLILILGKAVALVQVIFTLGSERALTDEEKRQLRRAFKDSLNYYVMRVSEGHAGIFQPGANKFTLGNTIYFKGLPVDLPGLVHESVHVWQYQNGGARYITDNIWAMITADNFNADDVYVTEINGGKNDWEQFHDEAQSELIEDMWEEGQLLSGDATIATGNGVFYDADGKETFGRFVHLGADHTDIANRAVISLRDGRTPGGWW